MLLMNRGIDYEWDGPRASAFLWIDGFDAPPLTLTSDPYFV